MAFPSTISTSHSPPAARDVFTDLAVETKQHIASFIESDIDLCNFRLVISSMNNAVDDDNLSFWRRRFLAHFDKFTATGDRYEVNLSHKVKYQERKHYLKYGALFQNGETDKEMQCLVMVVEMMLDAFSEKGVNNPTYESPNMALIQRFIDENDVLRFEGSAKQSPTLGSRRGFANTRNYSNTPIRLMQIVQVMCAPMLLRVKKSLGLVYLGFNESQQVVYNTPEQAPLLKGIHGMGVNMEYVLHNINFWKHHMLRPEEATLYRAFSELSKQDRPRWWSSQLKQGVSNLGKNWKGCYAYISPHDLGFLRYEDAEALDCFGGEEDGYEFQNLTLNLVHDNKDIVWPETFEEYIPTGMLPTRAPRTRAQKRARGPGSIAAHRPQNFSFAGDGEDTGEEFMASGWLSALPEQEGVPGWQRMTMMKYFKNTDGSMDELSLWAYEGVVLPGGQMIIGRWWSPINYGDDELYSGPFLFWCVDGPQ